MPELSAVEALIYNDGERLIPGVTHDRAEEVRHHSSYAFWRAIIELDREAASSSCGILRVADLGCGVGHGCLTLSEVRGASVVGVDVSEVCVEYARERYGRDNIEYVCADVCAFVAQMPEFDYIVSRGAIEHVPGGLELLREARWRRRLMFDVPFDEPAGRNPHHVVNRVTEQALSGFTNREFLFQDLDGVTFDETRKPARPNMIMCVARSDGLPSVAASFRFPRLAWDGPRSRPRRRWPWRIR